VTRPADPHAGRALVVHAARVAVVAAIAWLVHAEHVRHVERLAAADRVADGLGRVSLDAVRRHLPAAAALGGPSDAVAGGRDLLDAAGGRVGTALRTSPAGDVAIGFSGPTDVLVVCDAELRVAGMEVLSSRDTRDHVRAVERDAAFWRAFTGRALAEIAAAPPDRGHAVAGATLTSLAIAEAVARRLGGTAGPGRFDAAPMLDDLRILFPAATTIATDPGDPSVIRVAAADDTPLGWALRTSPAADRIIGYQGPTDALVGFDAEGRVCGVAVLTSYDNEPYVGYVRDDAGFRGIYRGMSFAELAGVPAENTGVEGVSGATMTSQAVATGIVRAAGERRDRRAKAAAERGPAAWAGVVDAARRAVARIEGPQWGAIGIIAAGLVTAFTRLKGGWFGRVALPVAVLAYLGFGAGALVSLAQLVGWVQSGVPQAAPVLAVLAAAALVPPPTTRRNVYCSHLCAHGAAQQLLVRVARPRRAAPGWLRPWLAGLPWALLVTAIVAAAGHLPLDLVDLEPFDAYLPAVAGTATLVLFATSLVAGCFVPMAYCRHGCPTGALLDHLRLHRRSDRVTWRDGLMLGCLVVAAAIHWWPR